MKKYLGILAVLALAVVLAGCSTTTSTTAPATTGTATAAATTTDTATTMASVNYWGSLALALAANVAEGVLPQDATITAAVAKTTTQALQLATDATANNSAAVATDLKNVSGSVTDVYKAVSPTTTTGTTSALPTATK
jgi:uncharacterized protein YceK